MDILDNYKKIYTKIQEKPLIPKKSYTLNKEYIKKYINASLLKYRYILKKLFDNTKHISYRTFKFVLYNNFRELIHYCKTNKIEKISLYLDKIDHHNITLKSNFWVAQHFYQYIKKNNFDIKINIIYNKNHIKYLDKNELLVILDDCAYTGSQLKDILEDINRDAELNIYIIIAFITREANTRIKNVVKNNKYYKNNIILSKNNVIINDFYYYLTEEEQILAKSLSIKNKYPIYFDHKLADYVSTYTAIYSGEIIKKHLAIPVINNCEHINFANISVDEPKCPISSYKINTADIANFKNDIKYKSSSSYNSAIASIKSDNIIIKKDKKSINIKDNILIHYDDYIAYNDKKEKEKLNKKYNEKLIDINNIVINSTITLPNISYNLNKNKIKKYYKLISPEIVPIVKKIIKRTIHISHIDFFNNLNKKIIELKKEFYKRSFTNIIYLKLFIFDINSTNRWISQYIYHNINNLKDETPGINWKYINILIINDLKEINDYDFVLYADDYIHTGYFIKNFYKKQKYLLPYFQLFIFAPYINFNIYTKIKSYYPYLYINIINTEIVYPLQKYLKKEEIDIFKKYTNYNLENKYAIYADHNMYSDKYVPTMIYYGDIITDNYTKKSKKELFPLIDNCDISNCIIPLYKINDSNNSYYIDISGDSNEIIINNLKKKKKKKQTTNE